MANGLLEGDDDSDLLMNRPFHLTWHPFDAEGWVPGTRMGHTSVVARRSMYIFGGVANSHERCAATLELNLDTRHWFMVNCDGDIPPGRAYHVSWAKDGVVYIHGGEGVIDPTLEGGGISSSGASSSSSAASAVDGGLNLLGVPDMPDTDDVVAVVNDRVHPQRCCLDDLYALDVDTHTWRRVRTRLAPLPRKGHSVTAFQHGGCGLVLFFGGAPSTGAQFSNAVYTLVQDEILSGRAAWTSQQTQGGAPRGRYGHSMTAMDATSAILFGGVAHNGDVLNDLHVLSSRGEGEEAVFVWNELKHTVGRPPTGRYGHCACLANGLYYEDTKRKHNAKGGKSRRRRKIPKVAPVCAVGSLLIFGGAMRIGDSKSRNAQQQPRLSFSHEMFAFEPAILAGDYAWHSWERGEGTAAGEHGQWCVASTGHAFPNARYAGGMAGICQWTPPEFNPDGTVMTDVAAGGGAALALARKFEAELGGTEAKVAEIGSWGEPWEVVKEKGGEGEGEGGATSAAAALTGTSTTTMVVARRRAGPAAFNMGVKRFAVMYGGLNSMYCNGDTWLLELSWQPDGALPSTVPKCLLSSASTPNLGSSFGQDNKARTVRFADGGGAHSRGRQLEMERIQREADEVIMQHKREAMLVQMQLVAEGERRQAVEDANKQLTAELERATEELGEVRRAFATSDADQQDKLAETEAKLQASETLVNEAHELLRLTDLAHKTHTRAVLTKRAAEAREETGRRLQERDAEHERALTELREEMSAAGERADNRRRVSDVARERDDKASEVVSLQSSLAGARGAIADLERRLEAAEARVAVESAVAADAREAEKAAVKLSPRWNVKRNDEARMRSSFSELPPRRASASGSAAEEGGDHAVAGAQNQPRGENDTPPTAAAAVRKGGSLNCSVDSNSTLMAAFSSVNPSAADTSAEIEMSATQSDIRGQMMSPIPIIATSEPESGSREGIVAMKPVYSAESAQRDASDDTGGDVTHKSDTISSRAKRLSPRNQDNPQSQLYESFVQNPTFLPHTSFLEDGRDKVDADDDDDEVQERASTDSDLDLGIDGHESVEAVG